MPKFSNNYTLVFVTSVAVICSLLLALASSSLKDKQDANQELFVKRNILRSFGEIYNNALEDVKDKETGEVIKEKMTVAEVNEVFETRIEGVAVKQDGSVSEEVTDLPEIQKIEPLKEKKKLTAEQLLPVFIHTDEQGEKLYTVPVYGKGLWSTLGAYIAFEENLNVVKGITFYMHKETPGLGAEIQAEWFQDNFIGKRILENDGSLVAITVTKAGSDKASEPHNVDGISGATLTGNGVTEMMHTEMARYKAYFDRIRQKNTTKGGV